MSTFVNSNVGKNLKLKSEKEIFKARHIAEVWHWRATQERIAREKLTDTPLEKIRQFNYTTALYAQKKGHIDKVVDQDFVALGKPYKDLTDEEFHPIKSISMERHFALNWLCGLGDSWDETPTNT